MAARQNLDRAAGEFQVALYRLVAVSHRAQGDEFGHIAARLQLPRQHLGDVAFGDDLGLKIQPGRQVEVAVRGPCIAVHAAVLAAAIRVQAVVKVDIGRVVVGDGAFAVLKRHLGLQQQLVCRLASAISIG